MLTAQPSTYDMFALIELFGRTVQSVYLASGYKYISNLSPQKNYNSYLIDLYNVLQTNCLIISYTWE